MMFDVVEKVTGNIYKVYSIRNDTKTGYPQFLIYKNNQWLWRSAKYFKPTIN